MLLIGLAVAAAYLRRRRREEEPLPMLSEAERTRLDEILRR
jgi:cytochrome c-type biogenesis protein CcmH/NrfF